MVTDPPTPIDLGPTEKPNVAERNGSSGSSANNRLASGTRPLELLDLGRAGAHQDQFLPPPIPGEDEKKQQGHVTRFTFGKMDDATRPDRTTSVRPPLVRNPPSNNSELIPLSQTTYVPDAAPLKPTSEPPIAVLPFSLPPELCESILLAMARFTESCMCGCGGGACVPRREYDRSWIAPLSRHELEETILFSVNGKCGYPLADALREQYVGLDGKDDMMFVDFRSDVFLRLEVRPSVPAGSNDGLDTYFQWLPYSGRRVSADCLISLHGRQRIS